MCDDNIERIFPQPKGGDKPMAKKKKAKKKAKKKKKQCNELALSLAEAASRKIKQRVMRNGRLFKERAFHFVFSKSGKGAT